MSNTRVVHLNQSNFVTDSIIAETEKILEEVASEKWEQQFEFPKGKCFSRSYYDMLYNCKLYSDFEDIMDLLQRKNPQVSLLAARMLFFLRAIPIYEVGIEGLSDSQNLKDSHITGFYQHSGNKPTIYLFPDNMPEIDKEKKCVMTLIHELSHAVLDSTNYSSTKNPLSEYNANNVSDYCSDSYSIDCAKCNLHKCSPRIISVSLNPDFVFEEPNDRETPNNNLIIKWAECDHRMSFYRLREESLANLLMYYILSSLTSGYRNKYQSLDLVKSIQQGPCEYNFAQKYIALKLKVKPYMWVQAKEDVNRVISKDDACRWMKSVCAIQRGYSYGNEHFDDKMTWAGKS